METTELSIIPQVGMTVMRKNVLNREAIEDAVIVESNSSVEEEHPHFIESNTNEIKLVELTENCIVPVFGDNSLTISHQNFIQKVYQAANDYFIGEQLGNIECRVSHQVTGRIPSALHKKANELREDEKTLFYQRMAFCFEIKSIKQILNGEEVHLCIGGVRSYHEENLYSRKSPEKFKIFIGYRVKVCSNLMLTCDGLREKLEAMSELDIYESAIKLFKSFEPETNLRLLENLGRTRMTTQQYCQLIGRLRLYQVLPASQQRELPTILLGDSQINAATKGFVSNENFGEKGLGSITCWQLMQLLNEAAKSSYIDKWLERNQNATDIAIGVQKALTGEDNSFSWFLS